MRSSTTVNQGPSRYRRASLHGLGYDSASLVILGVRPFTLAWQVVSPRYYVVRDCAVFPGTMGGLKVTEKLKVADRKDVPIPGFDVDGFGAGAMCGDSYPINSSFGLASAFALDSGAHRA
jgi:hypothetical protein